MNTGPITLKGGTGPFTRLKGTGWTSGQAQMASGSAKSQACSSSGSNCAVINHGRSVEVAAWGRRVNGLTLTPAVNGQPWASNIGRDFGGIRESRNWLARLLQQGHFSPSLHRQLAPPEPFTITEDIDFEAGEFAFTASDPLLPVGHLQLKSLQPAQETLRS